MVRYVGRSADNDPDDIRGRQLAREAIVGALYGTGGDTAGFIPGVLEAIDSAAQGDQLGVLIGMLAEQWVWAQVSTQMLAEALDVSVEEAVALIIDALSAERPPADD